VPSEGGLALEGGAQVVLVPPIVAPPVDLAEVRTVARVIDTAPTLTQPAAARTASTPEARYRFVCGNRDLSFEGDAYVQVDNIKHIDPLLYGSAQVTLPGINPQFVDYDLVERFGRERTVLQLVLDGEVVSTMHKGFVSRVDTSGTSLTLQLGGEAAGRMSGTEVTDPVYRRRQDVEHICCDLIRDARVRAKEHEGSSGIGLIKRSGDNALNVFNEYLDIWKGASGDPVTFTPNNRGAYRKTVKDTTTIHATAYIDSSLVSQDLSVDFMEAQMALRVYARGFTNKGELVTNIKTPGMTQGDPPAFPSVDPLTVGDTDADTTTGAGVTAIQEQLALHNFYDVNDGVPGEFTASLASAVMTFQAVAGLTVTGDVGETTWDELWNLAEYGYSLDGAREYPTAQDTRMVKWFRTANGSKIRLNPAYDPHLPPNDVFIDVGGPFGKGEIRKFAESKLAPDSPVWMGTLTFRSGLIVGEHNPSDALVAADVMDRRDLRPNMNVWLPHFNGGLLVTLTGVDHGPDETQALVSTHPATTMETWAAIERRREGKSNPGRAWSGHVRQSQVRRDTGATWDTSSGLLANKVALVEGWNEVKIPAGQAGIIKRVRMQLEDAAEFAVIITTKQVSVPGLNSRIEPMSAPTGRPWYERANIVNWLNKRGLLDAWGTPNQPCGYDPSRKTGDDGAATAEPTTGLFVEYASMTYETGVEPVLYAYVWVGSANALMPGRVLRNQRTTDF
jgi:peptidoglycan hydrolase-like protein with peptidoglycan-binding domain